MVFVQGSRKLAKQVLEIDIRIVDGLVNMAGFVTLITGEGLKYLENGRAQFYALIVFGAVLGLVLVSGSHFNQDLGCRVSGVGVRSGWNLYPL